MLTTDTTHIRIGHSPDPDDAFMFYALAREKIDTAPYHFTHEMADIESLNRRAERGELEVSAISMHSYPYVCSRYALLDCGCSMGDGYGPTVITRQPQSIEQLRDATIAIPGERTTANLVLRMCLEGIDYTPVVTTFDEIPQAVADGTVDAGLIIHEAQLTYRAMGLHKVVDLAEWWMARNDLPLPLGGNVIRRDLGPAAMSRIAKLIHQSIQFALDHREQAVEYASEFGRGLDTDLTDKFVGMYVNNWTLSYGPRGREAVRKLLAEAAATGMVPDPGEIEFVS